MLAPVFFHNTCSHNFSLKSAYYFQIMQVSVRTAHQNIGKLRPRQVNQFPKVTQTARGRAETEIQGSHFSRQNSVHYSQYPSGIFMIAGLSKCSLHNSRGYHWDIYMLQYWLGNFGSAPVQSTTSPLSWLKFFGFSFFRIYKDLSRFQVVKNPPAQ